MRLPVSANAEAGKRGIAPLDDQLALAVGVGAGLALFIGLWMMSRLSTGSRPGMPSTGNPTILLRDGVVIDMTADTASLLPSIPHAGQTWEDLRLSLLALFPDMPEAPPDSTITIAGGEKSEMSMHVESRDGSLLRCTLDTPRLTERRTKLRTAEMAGRSRLQAAVEFTPQPIWQSREGDRVEWFNAAYAQLCQEAGCDPHDAALFTANVVPDSASGALRARIPLDTGAERWFEVTTRATEAGTLHFASAIDTLVEAEMAQRKFVQTLTKTFAHLSIGLAVFDRDHRLVLFNPALVDLTRLPVEFLSSRPNLLSFFDHMRENRMMPEPKSYATWRERLADVICAARDDRYCETWNLPSGLTYKITGRPHPDRAIAFLLEDISAEISLTRRFRSELELTQSVIDCFDDAVAVFSQLGVLTFCNAAYREMWKCDPDSTFSEVTITDATLDWQQACEPSPIWADLREFVMTLRERASWDAPLQMIDGPRVTCRIEPVTAGATMVRFSPVPARSPERLDA